MVADDRPRLRLPRPARWFKRLLLAGAVVGAGLGAVASARYLTVVAPSASMWPTIRVGERLYARRGDAAPERGTMVVFRYPERPDQLFVKRAIGVAGDVVAVTKGQVTINGWSIPRCVVGKISYADPGATGDSGAKHEGTLAVEWLGSATYLVFDETTGAGPTGDGGRWTVAAGEYFVLGDNRNNSHDSRAWFAGAGGGVPLANTRGRVHARAAIEIPPIVDNARELAGALRDCLALKPAVTSPPASR